MAPQARGSGSFRKGEFQVPEFYRELAFGIPLEPLEHVGFMLINNKNQIKRTRKTKQRMKQIILKSMVSMMALATLTVAPGRASAQQSAASAPDCRQQPNERLEGVWDSHLTATDCHGHVFFSLRAFEMFSRGGTLTSVDNSPPIGHGPGLGRWEYLGGQKYSAPFQFFNFNPDGSFAGVQKIQRTITLDADADHYTSVVRFEATDPNGNVVFSGCGTESAVRLQ
jgi:hypothetical protein